MNEPLLQNLQIALSLSKLNPSMSEAEAIESCKIYFEIVSSKTINEFLILEIKKTPPSTHTPSPSTPPTSNPEKETISQILQWLKRLALTKEAHLIIGNYENEKIIWKDYFSQKNKEIRFLIKNKEENTTFKISTRSATASKGEIKNNSKNQSLELLAKELGSKNFKKTLMNKPDIEFTILKIDSSKNLIGIKLWENKDPFEKRRAHLRPVSHPTAINPRLARAMINIAGAKKEVFDPFCGIGGILLEASKINLKAKGTDLEPLMIKRAELNLKEELLITLYCMDALNWHEKVECVITDLPYGKSSKLDCPLSELTQNFLSHYAQLTDKITFCTPQSQKFKIPSIWKIKYNFQIYIHKNLTRNIFLLEKAKPE